MKDNASYDGTAVISGAATFVIRGNGAVSLRGDNTFTGAYTTGFVTGGGTLQSCGGGMMLFVR